MQFNFKSLVVILDKIDSTGALPNCYDFDQVRNQNHHIPPLSIILQGSICLPGEVWGTKPGLGHVVVSALEFYNGDNLLFPAFQTHPQSNLASIISLSVDNNSKVELPQDGEPIRIRFNQVPLKSNLILSDSYFLALKSPRHQLWFLGLGESMVVWGRLRSESWPKQWNRNRVWLLPSDTIQPFHGLDGRVLWSPIFPGPRHYHKGKDSFYWFLVKHIDYTGWGLQVFLGMSLFCLFFVEGCKYCKQDPAKEKFNLHQISRSHRRTAQRFCNIYLASSSFKFFSCSPSTSSLLPLFLGLSFPF